MGSDTLERIEAFTVWFVFPLETFRVYYESLVLHRRCRVILFPVERMWDQAITD